MKDQDSIEKDARIATDGRDAAPVKPAGPEPAGKELTDDQLAAISGGVLKPPPKHPGQ
jgi:bacteriocin-like protein